MVIVVSGRGGCRFRMNLSLTADEATMLLSVDDFDLALAREVPPREGAPVVGVDLGER